MLDSYINYKYKTYIIYYLIFPIKKYVKIYQKDVDNSSLYDNLNLNINCRKYFKIIINVKYIFK